jgi:hypothetical protein
MAKLHTYEAIVVWHDKANVTNWIKWHHPETLKTDAFNKKGATELIKEQIRNGFGFFIGKERVGTQYYGKLEVEVVRIDDDSYTGYEQSLFSEGGK